jgi:hypothetical protein
MKIEMATLFFVKLSNIKVNKTFSKRSRAVSSGRQMDGAILIGAQQGCKAPKGSADLLEFNNYKLRY